MLVVRDIEIIPPYSILVGSSISLVFTSIHSKSNAVVQSRAKEIRFENHFELLFEIASRIESRKS